MRFFASLFVATLLPVAAVGQTGQLALPFHVLAVPASPDPNGNMANLLTMFNNPEGTFPDNSHLTAVTTSADDSLVVLLDGLVSRGRFGGPPAFSLTGGQGQPSSVASSAIIHVTLTAPSGTEWVLDFGGLIKGVSQDGTLITIFGSFDPLVKPDVYLSDFALPVNPAMVTVQADRIVVDLTAGRSISVPSRSGQYSLAVVQGTRADSVLYRFTLPSSAQ